MHGFLRFGSFGESRNNGTPLQINDTRITSLDLGINWSALSIRVYGSDENFNQNFSAVAADRNSEVLTNRQRNPSQQLGFALQWRRMLGARQSLSAGVEGRVPPMQQFLSDRLKRSHAICRRCRARADRCCRG